MINNLVRLYYLGWMIYSTREVWLPPHLVARLPHDALFGMVYAATSPGILASAFVKGPTGIVVLGGSVAFWLMLLGLGKLTKRQPRPPISSGSPALPPGWEAWSRKRTFHTEWEEE